MVKPYLVFFPRRFFFFRAFHRIRHPLTGRFGCHFLFFSIEASFMEHARPNVRHPSSRNLTRRPNKSYHYESLPPCRDNLLFKWTTAFERASWNFFFLFFFSYFFKIFICSSRRRSNGLQQANVVFAFPESEPAAPPTLHCPQFGPSSKSHAIRLIIESTRLRD